MSERPILSITFMTPGKKKTLEMCLESIRWMQKDFPCELVIVDTGCDAEHRALIEKYADKIVDFTWINDFAAARNAGIAACSGEWFMIMDDDEVIKDYKPLKDFFESGEYKNHQWIMTMEHDFKDWEESNFEQYYWTRATRNEPGYCYEGKIHEYLIGPTTPAIAIPAVFGHYGYIFDTDEQRMEHSERNITLLEATLREQPENVHAAIQLAQEYHVIKEREKKEAICKKYYPLARDAAKATERSWKDSLYCGWVDAVYASGDDVETLKLVEKGLEKKQVCDEAKTFLYCIGAHIHYRQKDYSNCVDYVRCYLEFYNQYIQEVEVSGAFFFVKTAYDPVQYDLMLQCALLSAVWLRDESLFGDFIDRVEWSKDSFEVHDGIYETFKMCCGDIAMRKMAGIILERIAAVKKLREHVLLTMEKLETDYAPLYLEISDLKTILPYIKGTTYERLLSCGVDANIMNQLPQWQCAQIKVKWALSDFLEEDASPKKRTDALERLVEAGEEYFPEKYTERALQEEVLLSQEALLWKTMTEVLEYVHNNQPEDAIRCAKKVMGVNSAFDKAIANWIHGYADSISVEQNAPTDEMLILARQIKLEAESLIESGEKEAARNILLQLQALMPQDIEVEELLGRID